MNLMIDHAVGVEQEYPVTLTKMARTGRTLAVGVMKAGTLTQNYVIPRRDQRNKSGYHGRRPRAGSTS